VKAGWPSPARRPTPFIGSLQTMNWTKSTLQDLFLLFQKRDVETPDKSCLS